MRGARGRKPPSHSTLRRALNVRKFRKYSSATPPRRERWALFIKTLEGGKHSLSSTEELSEWNYPWRFGLQCFRTEGPYCFRWDGIPSFFSLFQHPPPSTRLPSFPCILEDRSEVCSGTQKFNEGLKCGERSDRSVCLARSSDVAVREAGVLPPFFRLRQEHFLWMSFQFLWVFFL
ncbi:hypothetical protein CDAR_93811 [Caerostris darwini]|uniref:Uncharacterized protein n=1 Tax=Caerostris darwini TaxID=1538125 RepID=A0AAV4NJS1_9ARAC|nr:hypothetical protein CDAR_93811 [Caerostris darwini]